MNYTGGELKMLGCDLGDRDAPQYVREAADQLGRFDILVNNAAAQGPSAMPPTRWPACLSSNEYTREFRDDHRP